MDRQGVADLMRYVLLRIATLAAFVAILAALSAACGGGSTELSLDEYLARMDCESLDDAFEEEPETYGEFAATISAVIDRMSPLVPPTEVAEWHRTILASLEEFKASLDDFPKDDEIDLFALAGPLESFEETDATVEEALNRIPDDVRQRLDDAGCS